MKDALIGIVLNKVWLIYKLHPFEFGVIYFLFFILCSKIWIFNDNVP